MKILRNIEKLVVDANPILSAIIGGKAGKIFLTENTDFYTTEFTVKEVEKYLPHLAAKKEISQTSLYFALTVLPLIVLTEDFYTDKVKKAKDKIEKRDPKDYHILALALKLALPLWTNDKDFKDLGAEIFSTEDLLHRLKREI